MVGQSMFCFRCGNNNKNARLSCRQCGCYVRCDEEQSVTTERTIITNYFYLGLRYIRIVQLLSKYKHTKHIQKSKSTLKRRLKEYNLKTHDNVPIELLHSNIQRKVRGPAASFGYRKMQRHLRSKHKLNVPRDNVMNILKEVDSEGTEIRQSRKLCRRKYISPGPDHCWHTDGYDKLKPFRLPIHGAIDRSQNHTISGVPDEMYYLPENFGYEHRGLVIDDEHINNILQRKNIYEETNNVTEAHEDLQDYFWHVVNCEKLPFPPTTWEEATMIFKRIIEKVYRLENVFLPIHHCTCLNITKEC